MDFKYFQKYSNIILLLILAAGIYLRLYRFPNTPDFTDEVRESLVSYSLYKFQSFPLTNYAEYIGPVYNYALALFMWIFGLGIWTPRIFVLIGGILTIFFTYKLGKEWINKRSGLVAAVYVALSPTLILINSRISWATCFSPLFGVLYLLLLKRSYNDLHDKNRKFNSIGLGLVASILMQLHPIMIFVVVPVIVYWIFGIYKKLVKRDFLINIGVFALAGIIISLPLIIANIKDPWISIKGAQERNHISKNNLEPGIKGYVKNLSREIAQTEHLSKQAVIFETFVIPQFKYEPFYYIDSWDEFLFMSVIAGVIFMGINAYQKRRYKLLVFPIIISLFLIGAPFLTIDYFEGLKIRYYTIFIPLFGILIAYGFDRIYKLLYKIRVAQFSYVAFLITMLTTPPFINLYIFFSQYDDRIVGRSDADFLSGKANNGYKLYYVDPKPRDNMDFSLVEYLIKFSGVKEENYVVIDANNYVKSDKDIIVLPDKEDDLKKDPLRNFVRSNKFSKIYSGGSITVYGVKPQ